MLLDLTGVEAGYAGIQVLFGVSIHVDEGEAIALLGRNGMGKTTTVKAIMGICRATAGEIRFRGKTIAARASNDIAKLGIGLVPEGRRIFPNLTVRENLLVSARGTTGKNAWTFDRVVDLFPRLKERLTNAGTQLSGGEQQMLSIGRALMTNPALLILDEATEGLGPLVRAEIWSTIDLLKAEGMSMIVIDKDLEAVCRTAERQYILEKGQVVWEGGSASLLEDKSLRDRYLSIGDGS